MMTMAPPRTSFAVGHELGSRAARDHFKDVLGQAESGGVAVIRRRDHPPVVLLDRDALGEALRSRDVPVLSSVTRGQFSFWIDGVPVHAVGDSLDEAEEAFLDALVDYSQAWFDDLHAAPNHRQNRDLAMLVAIYAGERPALHRVVLGDD